MAAVGQAEQERQDPNVHIGEIADALAESVMPPIAARHGIAYAFGGRDEEINYVDFEVGEQADELFRRTVIRRAGVVQHASDMTAIQRV